MALTQYTPLQRRGSLGNGCFGYQVAPGEQIWGGGIVGLNASGYLQRAQTAGTITLVGIAQRDYNNTLSSSPSSDWIVADRGWFMMAVTGASASNVDGNVYALDDNTVTMSGPGALEAASAVAGNSAYGVSGNPFAALGRSGANTGNGTISAITAADTTLQGSWLILFTTSTAFAVVAPDGRRLTTTGAAGSAYNDGGLVFTITSGGTAFAAGDSYTLTVSPAGAPLLLGTLSGFDKGTPCVRIKGS